MNLGIQMTSLFLFRNIVWGMIKQPLVMVLNPISMLGRHKT